VKEKQREKREKRENREKREKRKERKKKKRERERDGDDGIWTAVRLHCPPMPLDCHLTRLILPTHPAEKRVPATLQPTVATRSHGR
jgi:hypothetical protein